jgi:hypothetical protein
MDEMTTAADDVADEFAFEAFLAGRPVPGEADGGSPAVAAFAGAVRATATLPGRPNAALAELLATGLLTDQSSPSIRTAPSAGRSPRRSRVRRRRRFAMFFPALLAKFLSAGAMAQAATGATVAVVAFTGVGAIGALPDPVQDTFATVVAAVTPLEAPTSEGTTEQVVPEESVLEKVETTDVTADSDAQDADAQDADAQDADALEAEVTAWALEGPEDGKPFSAWVGAISERADVKDWLQARGLTFGNVVSAWANGKGLTDEQRVALGADLDEPKDGATEPVTVVDPDDAETATVTEETEADTATQDRGHGKATGGTGNGRGNGRN